MEHDIIYLKIELSQKWQKYDLVRFYSKRLIVFVVIQDSELVEEAEEWYAERK